MKKKFIKLYGENGTFNVKIKGDSKEITRLSISAIYSILDTFRKGTKNERVDFVQLVLGVLFLDGSSVEKFAESLLIEYKNFKTFQEGGIKND